MKKIERRTIRAAGLVEKAEVLMRESVIRKLVFSVTAVLVVLLMVRSQAHAQVALSNTALQSDSAGPSCYTDFYGFATQTQVASFSLPSGLSGVVRSSAHPRFFGGFGYAYQIAVTGGTGSITSLSVPFNASITNVFSTATSVHILGCSEQPGACSSPNPANDLDDLGFAGSPSPLSAVYPTVGTGTPTSSIITASSGGTYTTGFSGIAAGQTSRIFGAATTATTPAPGTCTATLTDSSGTTTVQVMCPSPPTITTVAGTGGTGPAAGGFNGDNQAATFAQLNFPFGVAVGGSFFIADRNNHRIRRVDNSGNITTVAGTGVAGFNGDNIAATNAQLNGPTGVALDGAGNLYIADSSNHRIRKVDTSGNITTVAGSGLIGFGGDGDSATAAKLWNPKGVAVSGNNLYIAEEMNQRIRLVDLTTRIISTVAGTGAAGFNGDFNPDETPRLATTAQLNGPLGVAVDGAGNLFIADEGNDRIRKVSTSGIITTVAAGLNAPSGVAVKGGDVFIANTGSNQVLKLSGGTISVVAGTGGAGFSGDKGVATSAQLRSPTGVAVDATGNVFIADLLNHRIRKVGP